MRPSHVTWLQQYDWTTECIEQAQSSNHSVKTHTYPPCLKWQEMHITHVFLVFCFLYLSGNALVFTFPACLGYVEGSYAIMLNYRGYVEKLVNIGVDIHLRCNWAQWILSTHLTCKELPHLHLEEYATNLRNHINYRDITRLQRSER